MLAFQAVFEFQSGGFHFRAGLGFQKCQTRARPYDRHRPPEQFVEDLVLGEVGYF
jgi:hypothetical protein